MKGRLWRAGPDEPPNPRLDDLRKAVMVFGGPQRRSTETPFPSCLQNRGVVHLCVGGQILPNDLAGTEREGAGDPPSLRGNLYNGVGSWQGTRARTGSGEQGEDRG